jgi:antitoxin (DNA-binding transcriptional repressor) of toxin-antitoxin stability system
MQTDGNPIMITNRAEEPIAAIVPVPQVPTVKELWLEPEEK